MIWIYQVALFQSNLQLIDFDNSSSDDSVPNKIMRSLLEAGLFR